MKWKQPLTAALGILLLQISGEVQAFECPVYFVEAQAAIEKADESIQRMEGVPEHEAIIGQEVWDAVQK